MTFVWYVRVALLEASWQSPSFPHSKDTEPLVAIRERRENIGRMSGIRSYHESSTWEVFFQLAPEGCEGAFLESISGLNPEPSAARHFGLVRRLLAGWQKAEKPLAALVFYWEEKIQDKVHGGLSTKCLGAKRGGKMCRNMEPWSNKQVCHKFICLPPEFLIFSVFFFLQKIVNFICLHARVPASDFHFAGGLVGFQQAPLRPCNCAGGFDSSEGFNLTVLGNNKIDIPLRKRTNPQDIYDISLWSIIHHV